MAQPQEAVRPLPSRFVLTVVGVLLIPALWVGLKFSFGIPDRFLPSPEQVIEATLVLNPPIFCHALATYARTVIGLIFGTCAGIGAGLYLWWSETAGLLLLPSFQTLRAVPAIATVPFFCSGSASQNPGKSS